MNQKMKRSAMVWVWDFTAYPPLFPARQPLSVAATVLDMSSGSVKNVLAEQDGIYRRFAESGESAAGRKI